MAAAIKTPAGTSAEFEEIVENFELFDDWEDRYRSWCRAVELSLNWSSGG